MGLPRNVLRPVEADWAHDWGGRPAPARYQASTLELGLPLGLEGVGANLKRLPPGSHGGPLHWHLVEEELFYVVSGELVVRELAPDADRYREYALRAGELVAYPPGTKLAHTSLCRAAEPALYLSLSDDRAPHEVCWLPDSGKALLRGFGIGRLGDDAEPVRRRAVHLGDEERPAWVAGPGRVPERVLAEGVHGRPLARAAGATRVFLNVDRLAPAAISGPLHWHTADDELVLVLAGRPTLRQVRDGVEERVVLQPGDAVGFRAGDRVAHQLRGGDDEAVLVVVGNHRVDDVTVMPELGEIAVRALGRRARFTPVEYWEGET
ncbi:MAG: cupin domain-containing protein [Myxococcota bacterium]